MSCAPAHYDNAELLAESIVREVGKRIVLALPLGLGKANSIANALYRRAAEDRSISLTIFTALTLEKPRLTNEIERRFMGPVIERLFGGYPDLLYARALRDGSLPPNIEVSEFFLLAGRWLQVPAMQQHYISANYTHAARYVMERGVNVVAQLVAKREVGGDVRYSLSCNTDTILDLLKERAAGRSNFKFVAEVNAQLPFMPGDGDVPAETFSHVLEDPGSNFPLFAPPYEPLGLTDHALGLNVARLVPDGGTLQIGIGREGDATAHALILRQRENASFSKALARLDHGRDAPSLHEAGRFEVGLYGLSEMLVATFVELIKHGVVKREVDGKLLQAAFFVGPNSFYQSLREMDERELNKINMTAVSFTNQLYGYEEKKRLARVKARFINSTMMATLMGAVVSDGLENGSVVSGVGGQYNFVEQAFALSDARAIITLKSTRGEGRKTSSNIRWSYGHVTIPRHLRDIIVSEYGVADLRGKSDRDVVAAMLSIADSRFQPELLRQAKDAGKIAKNFVLPAAWRENTPERVECALAPIHGRGLLPSFPFGTDFTRTEQRLIPALEILRSASVSPTGLARLALTGTSASRDPLSEEACLARLGLDRISGMRNYFYRLLLRGALRRTKVR